MPPTRPANTIRSSASPLTDPRLTTPFATVAATLDGEKGADQVQGCRECHCDLRRSAPVAMEVAIAFPVSWKPFVKSKARAVTTTTRERRALRSQPNCAYRKRKSTASNRRTDGAHHHILLSPRTTVRDCGDTHVDMSVCRASLIGLTHWDRLQGGGVTLVTVLATGSSSSR